MCEARAEGRALLRRQFAKRHTRTQTAFHGRKLRGRAGGHTAGRYLRTTVSHNEMNEYAEYDKEITLFRAGNHVLRSEAPL